MKANFAKKKKLTYQYKWYLHLDIIGSDYSIDLTCQERELTIWRVDYNVFSQHGKGDLSIAGTYQQI